MRVRTTPGGEDKFIKVNLEQKFDFIEILSLKLNQEDVYRKFCSDYGVVVGRVTINNGFGVPNAKVSIFIPIDDIDKDNDELFGLYPYEQVNDKNIDGFRYNLLPKTNETNNDCKTSIGSFFGKREIQDNDIVLNIYCKYYKFTTTTNSAGDFMFFGVPVGTYEIHVDADVSDIGLLSQYPYDLIREGFNPNLFETNRKFKSSTNLETLSQLKTRSPISIDVQPFWGDIEQCQVGITRRDVDLGMNIVPHAIFMGSLFSDNEKNSLNRRCRPRANMGKLSELISNEGRIEMIRKNRSGAIERFDVNGGMLIDEDGTWAYQVPMNLDYVTTDEFGNIVPTDNINIGLPTRASVRFRISMIVTGSEGRIRTRANYLVPNNPNNFSESDYSFDTTTRESSFYDMYWNKIYTITNYIPRVNRRCPDIALTPGLCPNNNNFTGLKDVNVEEGKNPAPFNKIKIRSNPLFNILCIYLSIIQTIIFTINRLVINPINGLINALNNIPLIGLNIPIIPNIKVGCNDKDYCVGCVYGTSGVPAGSVVDDTLLNSKWVSCIRGQLIDSLNIVLFNFYNDWLNGSLYLFLLKYKIRRRGRGREKFCEFDCDDDELGTDNNNDGQADNSCFRKFLVDTGTGASPQSSSNLPNNNIGETYKSIEFDEGLIKKDIENDILYYASITKNGEKLFATDIINLGSIFECDWQGEPVFYKYLNETSINLPQLQTSFNDDNTIEESGFINPNDSNLILNVSCFNLNTNDVQTNNIKRLCEIGMGLDEDRTDDGGAPADGMITNNDVENPFIRGLFVYLNSETQLSEIPLVYISPTPTTYTDPIYRQFRGYDDNNTVTNKNIWQFKKSFYFYFGLHSGKTALNKLLSRYLPNCEREKQNNLNIRVINVEDDNSDDLGNGSITFSVIGGIPPYNYRWLGPTYNNIQFECPSQNNSTCGDPEGNEFTLENLLPGQYTLTVIDSNGDATSSTITINGITPITCDVQPQPANTNGNGQVLININNGVPPYTITINGVSNTSFSDTISTQSQTYCYGACSNNNLPEGEYILNVQDSGFIVTIDGEETVISTQCSSTFTITQPQTISLNISTNDANCYNGLGNANISVNGGTPPYQFTWELLSTQNPNNTQLIGDIISTQISPQNLPSGNYLVTVTDLGGNISTTNTNIDEPNEIVTNNTTIIKPGCYYSTSGFIITNIAGGTPPYDITTTDGPTSVSYSNISSGNIEIGPLSAGDYKFNIIDSLGCQNNVEFSIPFPSNIIDDYLYVTTLYVESTNRVVVRLRGGHGNGYHIKLDNGNFINIIGNQDPSLPEHNSETLQPEYSLYKSEINAPNNEPLYEFQFTPQSQPQTNQPLVIDYVLSDNNQQDVYALFKGKLNVDIDNNYTGSQDSKRGLIGLKGCYSYRNINNTPVSGSEPKGILITQP